MFKKREKIGAYKKPKENNKKKLQLYLKKVQNESKF